MSAVHPETQAQSSASTIELPLVLDKVFKSFGPVKALENISISVRPNEVLGLIGENGAGKSTLLKILAGIHRPDVGQMIIHGKSTDLHSPADAARHGVAVVHQEQSLLTNLTVAENIMMGIQASARRRDTGVRGGIYNWRRINRCAQDALDRVGASIDPRAKVSSLSFAQRQMVEIAKAVNIAEDTTDHPLIVLDEPTSVLEKDDIEQLEREIDRLKKLGSLIFVSHRLDEILRICDRIYVMRGGEVVAERVTDHVDESELFALMTGRERVENKQDSYRTDTTVLDVSNLSAQDYRNVSFTVARGEVHTFLGVKNSGREELCRRIFGITPRRGTSGEISVDGRVLTGRSIGQAARAGIAYIPSERKTDGMVAGMTLSENLTLTNPGSSAIGPFVRPGAQKALTTEWIDRLEVRPPDPTADIAQLSGGNQQKIVLAKWLNDPDLKLLLLDHPTRGVDPGARQNVYAAVADARARGVGVLLIADTLEEALTVSDRITVMRDGEISATYDLRDDRPTMADLIGKMV